MIRIAAFLVIGIGVGLGFALWQGLAGPEDERGSGLPVSDRATLERRIGELETSLTLERYERQALAEELEALSATVSPADENEDAGDPRERLPTLRNDDDDRRQRVEMTAQQREQFLRQRQVDNFVGAGLSRERAEYILQREDELAMEALQARYDASRNGASAEEVANLTPSSLLRRELGDADYERYLEGSGRPTTIYVREVMTNSPAQSAGLQPGDEIVVYDGQRVFDMAELNAATYAATPGAAVAVEVLRDGQRVQVYVPGGPIGISGGGRSRRDR